MIRSWLLEKRTSKKLSHDFIAKGSEISRQYYGMIENGERTPSVDVAKKIAAIIGFEWTLFFNQERNKKFPSLESKDAVIKGRKEAI